MGFRTAWRALNICPRSLSPQRATWGWLWAAHGPREACTPWTGCRESGCVHGGGCWPDAPGLRKGRGALPVANQLSPSSLPSRGQTAE